MWPKGTYGRSLLNTAWHSSPQAHSTADKYWQDQGVCCGALRQCGGCGVLDLPASALD